MSRMNIKPHPEGGLIIETDLDTADLIKAALEIVNPDHPDDHEWARDCAFNLSSAINRWPNPQE